MSKDVFDDRQLSAMKRAIDEIIQVSGEGANANCSQRCAGGKHRT
jgi:hypothetical protein